MTLSFDGVAGPDVAPLLADGTIDLVERLTAASNQTWLAVLRSGDVQARCVYKPIAGERPLWDFPTGTLAGREVAAHRVAWSLGWQVIPPTVLRDGPLGQGMCQMWVETDPEVDVIELAGRRDDPDLRRIALLDAVINNSDRKAGHLLATPDGAILGCDHGVSFSVRYKLRTVLWQWRGTPIPAADREALNRLAARLRDPASDLNAELAPLVTADEVYAARRRAEILAEHGAYPYPSPEWPAVPYPPV
ncbi:SCO1664 family protein [Spiractinospora alimapuensis]|uniref:SCO1664 family protein n=1 Tax=Spiractinospora alimapuensis TaxID=2820884 RepID=UPI001EEC4D85|nr:SCO1664 family protein [Spiractinospora alimapuensis]QVQ52503.1 SCO1664 family protein [Spiractinospora alimapuensis]